MSEETSGVFTRPTYFMVDKDSKYPVTFFHKELITLNGDQFKHK